MNISKRKRLKAKRTPWIDSKYGRTDKMLLAVSEMFVDPQQIYRVYFNKWAV
jgi:hypothetical protein